jgi:probable addiction module antidote protein
MSSLAEEVQLSRQNLYRMFSQKGNPRWDNLKVVLHSLGLELEVKSYKPR